MNDDIIIVEHWRTKNHYKVLNPNAKLKINDEWQSCVIYQDYKHVNNKGEYVLCDTNQVWVRPSNNFWNKFEICIDL